MAPFFDKEREFFQLGHANGGLHISRFQVITKMGIHVFMVVAKWQLAILFVKAVSAKVVFSGWAGAVSPPVSKRFDDFV